MQLTYASIRHVNRQAKAGSHLAKHGARKKMFLRSCVTWAQNDLATLEFIIDNGRPIKLATLRRHVEREHFQEFERLLGYATWRGRVGLRLQNDYEVSFYRSRLPDGRPVVYVDHSRIEYVFA